MSKDARPIFMAPPETSPLLNRTVFGSEHDDYRRGVRNFFEAEVYPHWEAWEAQGHVDRDLWNKAGAAAGTVGRNRWRWRRRTRYPADKRSRRIAYALGKQIAHRRNIQIADVLSAAKRQQRVHGRDDREHD